MLLAIAWFAELTVSSTAVCQEAPQTPWYQRYLVGMEVGPTGAQFGHSDPTDARYCSEWDGREIVRQAVRADAEYLVLWVRDGDYAYYDSALLPKAPGLVDRDPLADAVDEAAKHDLPLIAYCVVQQGGHFLQAHPEWAMHDADGNPIGRFCFNSGYLDAMGEIVAEQLAYGIDGFHIDMLDQGFGKPYGCWCETCQELFRQQFGHDMPAGATWDDRWDEMLEFRYQTSQKFERRLTDHIRSINPRATVDYNYHGNPPFSFEVGQRPVQHARNADFVTGETGVWGFSALGVGLNAEFYRAATPGRPFQVAMQRGVRMYHDQTNRPLNDLRWELLTLLAHGAFVTIVDKTAFDGRLDPVAYERMGDALEEARALRQHFGHEPVREVGLYFSSRTRDWWAREEPARYFQSFEGAHRACALEHLPFGILFDEDLSLDALREFPVVCLPNVTILSSREVSLFTQYVSAGGNLFVTGQSGQCDAHGGALDDSYFAELIGAKVVRRLDSLDNWLRLDGTAAHEFGTDIRPDWPFLVKGPATVYEPTTAVAFGQLHEPARTVRQREGRMGTDWPMSAGAAVGPALLVHRVGKGTVITCAASPDFATAGEHAIVSARNLFAMAVRTLLPERRFEIDAPANVEAVVTDDPAAKQLRVHLLGYNPTPRSTPARNRPYVLPGLIEDAPLFRVTLTCRDEPHDVQAADPATQIRIDGRRVEATIEDVHDVLVVDY